MRAYLMAAGLAACMTLSACDQSGTEASAPPPPSKKSMARPAALYAGQEQILKVDSATVELGQTPQTLTLKADGQAATPGYTDAAFVPRINAAPPRDGVYEVDVIATKPTGVVAQTVTPIQVKGAWPHYPEGRLKGVKFIAKTNAVTAMLPAAP